MCVRQNLSIIISMVCVFCCCCWPVCLVNIRISFIFSLRTSKKKLKIVWQFTKVVFIKFWELFMAVTRMMQEIWIFEFLIFTIKYNKSGFCHCLCHCWRCRLKKKEKTASEFYLFPLHFGENRNSCWWMQRGKDKREVTMNSRIWRYQSSKCIVHCNVLEDEKSMCHNFPRCQN